jgi:hypothetical protein
MHRPVKRQKVSAKAKTADENCLSAAAIVDPSCQSTNKTTTDSGLTTPNLRAQLRVWVYLYENDNLTKHRKACMVHGLHVKLSDLVDHLN